MGTLPLPPQMQVENNILFMTILTIIFSVVKLLFFDLQEVFDRHSLSDLNPRSKDTPNSQSSTKDDQVNNNTSDEHVYSKSPFSPCFQFIFPCIKKANKVNEWSIHSNFTFPRTYSELNFADNCQRSLVRVSTSKFH